MRMLSSLVIAAQLVTGSVMAQEKCNGIISHDFPIVIPPSTMNPVGPLFIGYNVAVVNVEKKEVCFHLHGNELLGTKFSRSTLCFNEDRKVSDSKMFLTLANHKRLTMPAMTWEDAKTVIRTGIKLYNDKCVPT